MDFITVSGTDGKRRLSAYLNDNLTGSWLLAFEGVEGAPVDTVAGDDLEAAATIVPEVIPAGGAVIVEANVVFEGVRPALSLAYLERPPELLSEAERAALPFVELALVEYGTRFGEVSELEVEKALKNEGVRKVVLFSAEEGRRRAFEKALDVARSRLGGEKMPDDVPQVVVDAVKKTAPDGKIECEQARELAAELGVEPEVVGRALDLLKVKITSCRLGCF